MKVLIVTLISITPIAASLMLLSNLSSESPPTSPAGISYTPHGTILIDGDAQFNNTNFPLNGVISGNGTDSDPYVIDGWEINATGLSHAISVMNTTKSFRISNCYPHDAISTGIRLLNIENGTLTGNNCSTNMVGVYCEDSSGITLRNNTLIYSREIGFIMSVDYFGARIRDCDNLTFEGNAILHNQQGVDARNSQDMRFANNTVRDLMFGVFLDYCNRTEFSDNNFINQTLFYAGWVGPGIGINFYYSHDTTIVNNTFSHSDLAMSIAYFENATISNNTCDFGGMDNGVSLWNSKEIIVQNNTITYKNAGVAVFDSEDITVADNQVLNNYNDALVANNVVRLTISGNSFLDNGVGIGLVSVQNSIVCNNTQRNATAYSWSDGISLVSSSDVRIYNNSFSENRDGIALYTSSSNLISDNILRNNTRYGVYLESGSSNVIWKNDFIDNHGAGVVRDPAHVQAYDDGWSNRWNALGSPHGHGNYWSDWRTPDNNSDGIVDFPYYLSGGAGTKDDYPLAGRTAGIPEPSSLILAGVMVIIFLAIGKTRKNT
jgi:parallel beta-helix repeat protein